MKINKKQLLGLLVSFVVIQICFINCSGELTDSSDKNIQINSTETRFAKVNFPPEASVNSTEEEIFRARQLLVKARTGVGRQDLVAELSRHGGSIVRTMSGIDVHIVELPENANERAVAALLAHNPKFEFAELNRMVKLSGAPNDPLFPSQASAQLLEAPLAWEISIGSSQIIADLDTGVNNSHPDLASAMVPGFNTYLHNTDTSDSHGHGTATSGTAAAVGNNGIGMAGIAHGAKIMPIKITDDSHIGYWSAMAEGIVWAADRGARVANISFEGLSCGGGSSILSAASYMANKGGLVVVSAGNSGAEVTCADNILIAVSGTDNSDGIWPQSTYGLPIDISAPSIGVTCTWGTYGNCYGTSFAAPLVSGVIALMIDSNPNLSAAQLTSILRSTADDRGQVGFDIHYGYGRVNAARAVASAKAFIANDTQNPTVAITSPTSGSRVSGTVAINVNASDNVAVSKVELYVAGALYATDSSAPYSFAYDSALRIDGNVTLQARAYDTSENVASTAISTVTIDNIPDPVDAVAPVVSISSPLNGSIVGGTRTVISATATDDFAVVGMSIYIDGKLVASSTTGSISSNWNSRKASAGIHTIRVDARDASGKIGSASVQVTK